MTFANSLDPDQARHNIELDLNLKLIATLIAFMKEFFEKVKFERKIEDLKVLKRSPDLHNNVKVGQGQLRLIIQKYFVLPYMGSGHFDQVT